MKILRICITSIGSATALNLIKLLRKQTKYHVEIIGLDSNHFGYTSGSLLVDQFIQSPLASEERYFQFMENVIANEKVDMLIPIHDYEIYRLSKQKLDVNMVLPDQATVGLFRDKLLSAKSMQEIGITVPPIIKLDSPLAENHEKVIIRDRVGVGSTGIQILSGADYLQVSNGLDENKKFVQRFITGDEYTVDVFSDRSGSPKFIIPRSRIEVKAGVATKVRIVYQQELIYLTKKILNKYPIPGFCNVQFIVNEKGAFFIELNPRYGGMSISSSLASVNVMQLFVDHFVKHESLSDMSEYMKMVKWNSVVTRYYEEMIFYDED
ncbi:ATP-grasp domain-containing protein [Paenibacillus sp. cl141a]|uniref:ATP-grasp domain-containing protein n=1 Tax=Paenibacillus sp. cl141a TaxID=1761877 RepID=UPI0008ACAEE5|nr:ATP-grasp domain-containing protein [Paenibacillus sp. cl141a]SEL34359.1 ATP-grasp domain-containing protein [Paenibacillus sp. cl141a]